jgi:membrane protein DedA with SNARE-associated domain
VSPWRFALAILIGRGIRYFGQGYLAVLYGERAAEIVRQNGAAVGTGLAILAMAIGAVLYWRQRSRRADPAQSGR